MKQPPPYSELTPEQKQTLINLAQRLELSPEELYAEAVGKELSGDPLWQFLKNREKR